MGSALDVRRGGREGGEVGGGGGGRRDGGGGEATNGNALARGVRIAAAAVRGQGDVLQQEAMVAAARDRAIRTGSVRQDLALNLPPRLELPDGEERPYGAQTNLHLRDPLQVSFYFPFPPPLPLPSPQPSPQPSPPRLLLYLVVKTRDNARFVTRAKTQHLYIHLFSYLLRGKRRTHVTPPLTRQDPTRSILSGRTIFIGNGKSQDRERGKI